MPSHKVLVLEDEELDLLDEHPLSFDLASSCRGGRVGAKPTLEAREATNRLHDRVSTGMKLLYFRVET